MPEIPPIVLAGLTGFISGVLLCIPVGPVNITIINEGARRGFKWALLIGAGATLMEMIYCAMAFTGFAAFFSEGWIKALMKVLSFAFLLILGLRYLMVKSVPMVDNLEHRIEERIETKLHPHSAFMTGFVRTLANPGVLLGWIILGASFISRGWVQPNWEGKLSCMAGVTVGVGLWFVGLSWAVSLGHKKFTERTMIRMERVSGVLLITVALIQGGHLAWELAKLYQQHRM
jgi:threonine/homoserine/homoserine lactone efflux protein